ncbi:MAG: hypothetical protein NTZ93_00975 [Candidatus Beckwithbacteria bacterium]|nr:hypothetical protein [Candidatus Beckwithbacteria bacterium]
MIIKIISIILGGIIGWGLPVLDKVAFIYIIHPEAQISQYLKYQLGKKDWKVFWQTWKLRGGEFDKLTSRGILFQLAWVVLAVFALTSTTNLFGKVLVIGLGLRVLFEEWREYLTNRDLLKQKLFWQVKKEISNNELKWYMGIKTIIFGWLCLLLAQ